MMKFTLLQRMTLTAMMIALYTIGTRFLVIPVTNYVRLSMGLSMLIFSSVLLGPISGAVVGIAGDLIGALLLPYAAMSINPLMTISYGLMGATPGLIMMMFRKFKNKDKFYSAFFFAFLTIIFISITTFMCISSSITLFNVEFKINLLGKILVPICAFILLVALSIFVYFFNRHFKKKRERYPNLPSPYQISFIVVFIEVIFTLFINTFFKMWLSEVNFEIIFFPQLFIAFIYIPANTIIVSYLCLLSAKTIKIRE